MHKLLSLRKATGLFIVSIFVLVVLSLHQNGPRVVLTDQTPVVENIPEYNKPIRSLKPDSMTDEERLEYNQQLYKENKIE